MSSFKHNIQIQLLATYDNLTISFKTIWSKVQSVKPSMPLSVSNSHIDYKDKDEIVSL